MILGKACVFLPPWSPVCFLHMVPADTMGLHVMYIDMQKVAVRFWMTCLVSQPADESSFFQVSLLRVWFTEQHSLCPWHLLEMQNLDPYSKPLSQNLYLRKIPRWVIETLQLEKHCSAALTINWTREPLALQRRSVESMQGWPASWGWNSSIFALWVGSRWKAQSVTETLHHKTWGHAEMDMPCW